MPKQTMQSTEVRVYKDDGVWWAEIQDSFVKTTRSTYASNSESFISHVEDMLEWVGLTLSDVTFLSSDDTTKKFIARARREASNA
jgi:hypothetical protein